MATGTKRKRTYIRDSANSSEVDEIVLESISRIVEKEGDPFKGPVSKILENFDGRRKRLPSQPTVYRSIQRLKDSGRIKLTRKGEKGFFTYSLVKGSSPAMAVPAATEMVSYDAVIQGPLKTLNERIQAMYAEMAKADEMIAAAQKRRDALAARIDSVMTKVTAVVAEVDGVALDGASMDGVSKDGVPAEAEAVAA